MVGSRVRNSGLKMQSKLKFAIVTGGTSGIGWAIACALAAQGARVLILARSQAKWDARRLGIPSALSSAFSFEAVDVRDQSALAACLARAIATFGAPSWVVTSAGVCEPGHFTNLSIENHENQWNTNYLGTLNTIHCCTPSMIREGWGHIILISSAAVFGAVNSYSAYIPSKAAVASLGDILFLELSPLGIAVTTAFPPDTDTPQYEREKRERPFVAAKLLSGMPVLSACRVAEEILTAAHARHRHAVPGRGTRLLKLFQGPLGAISRWRQLQLAKMERASATS